MLSDEEGNTSEYSHPPSSVHSTLESNPDVASMYKKQIRNQENYRGKNTRPIVNRRSVEISEDEDSSSDESDSNVATTIDAKTTNSTIIEKLDTMIN